MTARDMLFAVLNMQKTLPKNCIDLWEFDFGRVGKITRRIREVHSCFLFTRGYSGSHNNTLVRRDELSGKVADRHLTSSVIYDLFRDPPTLAEFERLFVPRR